jgi:hypothetical protein
MKISIVGIFFYIFKGSKIPYENIALKLQTAIRRIQKMVSMLQILIRKMQICAGNNLTYIFLQIFQSMMETRRIIN